MNNTKTTKRALLSSAMAILICVAMLIGTTFAWFTDSASSGVNQILAGNLDIKVTYKDGSNWKPLQDADSLFSSNLWEPGHTEFVTLKIENNGSLALKYKMIVSPVSESMGINVAGESFKLSDYLVFKTIDNGTTDPAYTSRDEVRTAAGTTKKLTPSALNKTGTMEANDPAKYVTLAVYMPESVGNEANYKTGTPAPFINLGITVLATQFDSESDSFGNDYDADVDYSNADRLVYTVTTPVSVTGDLNKDSNGNVTSSNSNINVGTDTVTIKSGDTSVTVPGSSLSEGENTLTLNVTKGNTSSNFTVPNGQGAVYYDVTPMLNGQELDSSNTAHAGEYYMATLPIGSSLQNVKIFHSGVELSNAVQTDGTTEYFQYDSVTGIATIYVKHFSPFAATFDAVAQIGNTYYGTLYEAVKACKSKETIKLLCDITLDKANVTYDGWAPCATGTLIGTLDGNKHTITLGDNIYFGTYFGNYALTGNHCMKNVNIVANGSPVYVQIYKGLFENVKVSGSIDVGNNTGAFCHYAGYSSRTLTFRNCEVAATMLGEGTAKNYNAAFVGYGMGSGVQFNFENCKMTGSLTCGVAAVFLGNDSQLGGKWKVNITNFTFGNNAVVRNTLTSGYNWKFNGIVAANAAYGTPVVTIDGTSYNGKDGFTQLVDAKNTIWEAKHFAYGPQDASLALTKNEDGTFTITPAANENAVKYVVTLAVYSTLKEGGSGLQSVNEVITPSVAGNITTELKDLKFIDETWVANNPDAVEDTLAGNIVYTLDGVSYYMITDNELCTLNGTPKGAQVYGVTAYDANGNIVASAPLTK